MAVYRKLWPVGGAMVMVAGTAAAFHATPALSSLGGRPPLRLVSPGVAVDGPSRRRPSLPLPSRHLPRPLLDALHDRGGDGLNNSHNDDDGSGSSLSGKKKKKTVAKASSLPLELAPATRSSSRSPSRARGPATTTSSSSAWGAAVGPYMEILRPQNILPAMLLVMMGAWQATRDPLRAVSDPVVLAMALASALVAVGSCAINDWFDLRVDRLNKPGAALVQGRVPPAHALGIGAACLAAAWATAWLAPATGCLRAIIRAAVVLVTLYTPACKPVPFLKNSVVALVTAASLALGGLATGAPFAAVRVPAAVVFLGIYQREILMDADDVEGDARCGIRTLPRLLGRAGALWAASGLVAGATLLGAWHVAAQNLALGQGWARAAIPTLVTLGTGAVSCWQNAAIAQRGFRHEDLSRWIALSPIPMAAALFMLGTGSGPGPAAAAAAAAATVAATGGM